MIVAVPALVLLTLLPQQPPPAPTPAPSTAPVTIAMPAERRPLPTRNVKVDVTITDQTGSGSPMKKVVSLVVAEGRSSLVRSVTSLTLRTPKGANIMTDEHRSLPLNVDAAVAITSEQRIMLELKFNYGTVPPDRLAASTRVEGSEPGSAATFGDITEQLNVLLTPGAPVIVSRSADASSDRTVTVEVKADIVK